MPKWTTVWTYRQDFKVVLFFNMQKIYLDKEGWTTNRTTATLIAEQTTTQSTWLQSKPQETCYVLYSSSDIMFGRILRFCSNILHGETSAFVSTLNKLKDFKCGVSRKSSQRAQRLSDFKTMPSLFSTFYLFLVSFELVYFSTSWCILPDVTWHDESTFLSPGVQLDEDVAE